MLYQRKNCLQYNAEEQDFMKDKVCYCNLRTRNKEAMQYNLLTRDVSESGINETGSNYALKY
jgi:hypothetical protein